MSDISNICNNSNVVINRKSGEVTIGIIGNFDGTTTPLVHKCCKKIQKSGDVTRVIIDFSRATHVDTTAFACVISFIKEHIGTKAEIFVSNLHDPEKNLLQILKVEKLIKIA